MKKYTETELKILKCASNALVKEFNAHIKLMKQAIPNLLQNRDEPNAYFNYTPLAVTLSRQIVNLTELQNTYLKLLAKFNNEHLATKENYVKYGRQVSIGMKFKETKEGE